MDGSSANAYNRAGLLYGNNLKAPDSPPYDTGSMLDLKNRQSIQAHEQN